MQNDDGSLETVQLKAFSALGVQATDFTITCKSIPRCSVRATEVDEQLKVADPVGLADELVRPPRVHQGSGRALGGLTVASIAGICAGARPRPLRMHEIVRSHRTLVPLCAQRWCYCAHALRPCAAVGSARAPRKRGGPWQPVAAPAGGGAGARGAACACMWGMRDGGGQRGARVCRGRAALPCSAAGCLVLQEAAAGRGRGQGAVQVCGQPQPWQRRSLCQPRHQWHPRVHARRAGGS